MVSIRNALLLLLLRDFTASAASVPSAELIPRSDDDHSLSLPNRLDDRQIVNFNDWRIQVALVFGTAKFGIVNWQSVSRSCAEIKEQDTLGKKVLKATWDCALGAVAAVATQLMAAASAVAAAQTAWPILKAWLNAHIPNANPPRSLDGRSLEAMNLMARDAVPHFSAVFGAEVRHLGHWNDTVTTAAIRKRDDGQGGPEGLLRPVFGTTLYGRDYHFSLLSHDERDDSLTFRLGIGSGDHGAAAGRLEARDSDRPYFTEGGLDYRFTNPNRYDKLPNVSDYDPVFFDYIYSQIWCQFHEDWDYNRLETNQIRVQAYDDNTGGTRLYANMAAFGPNGHSGIDEMGDFWGAIDINYHCTQEQTWL